MGSIGEEIGIGEITPLRNPATLPVYQEPATLPPLEDPATLPAIEPD